LIPRQGIASEALEQKFDGVVVPSQWVQVVPQVNGVVSRILFVPGQRVSKGDVLFEMDADDFAIDVRIAQAELDEASARLSLAKDAAERQEQLLTQNATARQLARQTKIEVEIARANVDRKEGALARAQLALTRTRIVAPLNGTVGRPRVAPGAFVEAVKGAVLAEIAQLDPILVSFNVPFVERGRALEKAGTSDAAELFDRSTLSLELPSERVYEHSGRPEYHGGQIDPSTRYDDGMGPVSQSGQRPRPGSQGSRRLSPRGPATIDSPPCPAREPRRAKSRPRARYIRVTTRSGQR
jgi:RND family efflux transporter MFP subunit